MTWPLRICFNALLAVSLAHAATVSGRVQLADSREVSVTKRGDFSDVVVWLEPIGSAAPALPATATATMRQKSKRFTPHILVVGVGATVDFPNFDPIFHNAFSNFAGQPFDTGLYAPGTSQKVKFRRPGVVRVFCNIHSQMSAVIVVLNTPYFAKTDASGTYKIENVPPGEYTLKVWHERAPEATVNKLERKITVNGSTLDVAAMVVSEAGYLALPHKNKHDQDYPPAAPDNVIYPGAKK